MLQIYQPLRWIAVILPVAMSLPMAWISIAKLTLLATGMLVMIQHWREKQPVLGLAQNNSTFLVGIVVAWFGLSTMWTSASTSYALHAWLKHSKLLIIPLVVVVLTHSKTTRLAIQSFVGAQGIVITLSWLMFLGIPIPTFSPYTDVGPVVFSTSYIDQAAMFAVASAMAWHLRHQNLWPKWVSYAMPIFALCNILFLLPGRTGYVMVMVLIIQAISWLIPKGRRKYSLVVIPMTLLTAFLLVPSQSRVGFERIVDEVNLYVEKADLSTSAGWRLNAWSTSLQAIASRPVQGYGVGSFVPAVKPFQVGNGQAIIGESLSSNPHQEFLLWGIELGVGGTLLLLILLLEICRSINAQLTDIRQATTAVVMVVLVACLFNSALFDDLVGDFLCFSLGLCLALGYTSHSTNHRNA